MTGQSPTARLAWDPAFIHSASIRQVCAQHLACVTSQDPQNTPQTHFTDEETEVWGSQIMRHSALWGPPAHSQGWLDSEPSHGIWGWIVQRDHFRDPCVHRRGFRRGLWGDS